MQHNHPNKQNGTAVFMALLILTLVTSLTILWFMQNRIAVRRTQQMLTSEQTYLYAQGVVAWAQAVLLTEKNPTSWPKLLPPTLISHPQVGIAGQIDDYQARINLNNMSDKDTQGAFLRLLVLLNTKLSEEQATYLVNAIVAWITPIPKLTPSMSAINSHYSQLNPPYLAASRPFQSISELRLVAGVNANLFLLLQPYLSALPATVTINLRYANAMIQRAYDVKPDALPNDVSEYYLVQAKVQQADQNLTLYSLLHRSQTKGKTQVSIVWQNRGTL